LNPKVLFNWIFDQLYGIWISFVGVPEEDHANAYLARVMYDPGRQESLSIPWPSGLAPSGISAPKGTEEIPDSDVLVITWTAAEARALADVLTPGIQSTDWIYYETNFAAFESQLTGRSPARSEGRLGSWAQVTIGKQRVTCFKSDLHPATDGPSLPTAQLVKQLIAEIHPQLVITTGTAGGAGSGTLLGDINIAVNVKSDFTTKLKGHPWSQQSWTCAALQEMQSSALARLHSLTPAGSHLPAGSGAPHVWYGDTVSTDFFAYDTDVDHFGLRAYAPEIRAVEMDDAAVAVSAKEANVAFMSVRNASDPVMTNYSPASSKQAAQIYQRYGYWTTVNSAIGTWALIAGLQ
jgi:nucleoside phosphorylase